MGRKITLLCALVALAALVASPVYAEVQNIKVSGDIQALAVYRNNYDLEDGGVWRNTAGSIKRDYIADDQDSFLTSIVRLRVDADLTDNIAACVRIANLRDWDADTHAAAADNASIILDLANITLKEMLYSPLTLIIGRQELMYGNGLIVGYGLYQDPNGSLKYTDLSPLHGYDAIRAILDYDPWTFDIVYAKMTEGDDAANSTGTRDRDSDIDLYGVNVGYKFDVYDAEAEGYVFYKRDPTYALTVDQPLSPYDNAAFDENEVLTMGLRGSIVPVDNLTLSAEVAGQLGTLTEEQDYASGGPLEVDREAMMVYAGGEYDFADVRFKPVIGVEYLYTSGEEGPMSGDMEAWDPMYRGKTMGTIRDCLESIYTTNDASDTSGNTNQHTIKFSGSVDLGEFVDGLTMDAAYLYYMFAEEPVNGADDAIGSEFNMTLTYDYTEDVQFLLDGAWFMPGDYYDDVHYNTTDGRLSGGGMATTTAGTNRVANDGAVSLIGSCKVTF